MRKWMSWVLGRQGMVPVLLLLAAFFSVATYGEQSPEGAAGGHSVAALVRPQFRPGAAVVVVAGTGRSDGPFATAAADALQSGGLEVVGKLVGSPPDVRDELERLAATGRKIDFVVASPTAGRWRLLEDPGSKFPSLGAPPLIVPQSYYWPAFLMADNLLNVANQIAVIAVIAVGMTMVIITGGIDLSVGSLVALSAVTATLLIRNVAGAESATPFGMTVCCVAGVAVCALVGLFSGAMVTACKVPPFIVTLAMMQIAHGLALRLTEAQSIYQVPPDFVTLGRGASLGLPNAVLLMLGLYLTAHIVMTRTILGRYIYAVGGNVEAARLSGVPVTGVLLTVYAVSGALAGLGGVILASQLKSGDPKYGEGYELMVIAAVVVGGTSLAGGEGRIFGTLIGALIIAVIQNGMNLTGVRSETQIVMLGVIILVAVLLDRFRSGGGDVWRLLRRQFGAKMRPTE